MIQIVRFQPHNILGDNRTWSVGIYVRLSDEDRDKKAKSDESKSIQNQISYLKNHIMYLQDRDHDGYSYYLYKQYCDDDFTGLNFNRGGFQELMHDIAMNKVDMIVVKTLSRLGRNDSEMQTYLKRDFEESGKEVRVYAPGDGYDSLYDNPMDIKIGMTLLLNEHYSFIQHKNVSIGMHTMQKEGKFTGAFAPYGYRKDPADKNHLLPDEVAASVVRRIFEEYLQGYPPKQIARRLTEDGIVSPSIYKKMQGSNFVCGNKISDDEKHWTSSTVKTVLENEMYIGTMVQGKTIHKNMYDDKPVFVPKDEWIRVEGTHEPIIDQGTWQKAQGMMKTVKRSGAKKDETTIFKGLLVCGDCGHAMRKKSEYYQKKSGEKSRYLYYNCGTYRDYGSGGKYLHAPKCSSHYISDAMIRKIILNDINTILNRFSNLKKLAEQSDAKKCRQNKGLELSIQNKTRQIEENKKALKNAKLKLVREIISDEDYKEITTELEKEIKVFQAEISQLKKRCHDNETMEINSWVTKLLEMGSITELDRATVMEFVDKIYVYENKTLRIVYRYHPEDDDLIQMMMPDRCS